jgi:hypothetical protein
MITRLGEVAEQRHLAEEDDHWAAVQAAIAGWRVVGKGGGREGIGPIPGTD